MGECQETFGIFQANIDQILAKSLPRFLFEGVAEIGSATSKMFADIVHLEVCAVIVLYVFHDLFDEAFPVVRLRFFAVGKLQHLAEGIDEGIDARMIHALIFQRSVRLAERLFGAFEFLAEGNYAVFRILARVAANRNKSDDLTGVLQRVDVFEHPRMANAAERLSLSAYLFKNFFLLFQARFIPAFPIFDLRTIRVVVRVETHQRAEGDQRILLHRMQGYRQSALADEVYDILFDHFHIRHKIAHFHIILAQKSYNFFVFP